MKSAAIQFVICLTLLPALAPECDVQASDRLARSAIFDEQHAADTAFDLHKAAVALPVKERFERLAEWILPGTEHPALRVDVAFSPTSPPPVIADVLGETVPESGRRLQSGGRLVSPVLDLIDAAAELGQLDELRQRVTAWQPSGSDGIREQTAILILIEIARGDADAALPHLERLLKDRLAGTSQDLAGLRSDTAQPLNAELLILERAWNEPALHELVAEMVAFFRPWVLEDFDRPIPHRYVAGFVARLLLEQERQASAEKPLQPLSLNPLTQWHPASRATATTRGEGQPPTDWLWRRGFVGNVDSHDDDYLIFYTPLIGNYEVECDVTGFEWRDSSLLVAGNSVTPVYTHKHFDIGSFRGLRPRRAFNPPLTKVRAMIHYRTVVRDGSATTYFNGRPVNVEPLPERVSPWVAIRSTRQHDGAVRNLRITGTPVIPDEVGLAAVTTLNDWIPYYEGIESEVNQPLWYVTPRGGTDNEITGLGTTPGEIVKPQPGQLVAGTQESLLRYFRPMAEDGEIEYEFYYVPGQLQAHPALDRLAFLLLPDGVGIHWTTDGPFDRTGLPANNVTVEPSCRRGPTTLPLKTDAWNQVRLALNGDTVTLTLNGELIYERPLEATNHRTFGLFHFADWSTLLVRRVVWRGNWPRDLLPLAEQELAEPDADFLTKATDHLTATFEHDFAKDRLPLDRFTLVRGDIGTHFEFTADGLLTSRKATGHYQDSTIAPTCEVDGDFDIVAEYAAHEAETFSGGKTLVGLRVVLDSDDENESILARRQYSHSASRIDQIVHCVAVDQRDAGTRRNFLVIEPMEESSGRLRLSRRGDQLYYLTAESDSPHYRLRSQRTIAKAPVALNGLRLMAQIFGDQGHISVVWKKLSIRAEKITGLATTGVNRILAELNEQRDKLPASFSHDFRKQDPIEEQFYRWGQLTSWQPDADGWQISAVGADKWTSSGVSVSSRIEGDFDVTLMFEPESLALPKKGEYSQVYLQMELSDKDRTSIGAIYSLTSSGEKTANAQVREKNPDGSYRYRVIGQAAVGTANRLRIARRGSRIVLLGAGTNTVDDQIIAEHQLSNDPIESRNLRLMLHTGGAGRVSTARWQSIDIRAAKIDGKVGAKVLPPPPAPGLFDRVLDFFK